MPRGVHNFVARITLFSLAQKRLEEGVQWLECKPAELPIMVEIPLGMSKKRTIIEYANPAN
jgi:hypothetical protein